MKKFRFCGFLILTILLFTFAASAQDANYEYGQTAELKGLTKVYLGGVGNVENIDRIRETIKKSKTGNLKIVKKREDADFILLFFGSRRPYRIGNSVRNLFVGFGMVVRPSTDEKRLRVLMNFYGRAGEKKQPLKFAQKFIEEYRKANGIN